MNKSYVKFHPKKNQFNGQMSQKFTTLRYNLAKALLYRTLPPMMSISRAQLSFLMSYIR